MVLTAARDAGIPRSSLYEYMQVWRFYWRDHDGEKLSAWRIIRLFPHLTYTHLRDAMRLKELDAALRAFDAASDGDPRFPDFYKSLPMTCEAFRTYLAKLEGRKVPPLQVDDPDAEPERVAWELEDSAANVLMRFQDLRSKLMQLGMRMVRVVIYQVRR